MRFKTSSSLLRFYEVSRIRVVCTEGLERQGMSGAAESGGKARPAGQEGPPASRDGTAALRGTP